MEGLSEGIILKTFGILCGVVLLAYADHWFMRFHKKEFEKECQARKESEKKIDDNFNEVFGEVKTLKVNQVKNCNDIKHLNDNFDKLEKRCYDRHIAKT